MQPIGSRFFPPQTNPTFTTQPTPSQQPAVDTVSISPRFTGAEKANRDGENNHGLDPNIVNELRRLGVDPKDYATYLTAPPDEVPKHFNRIIRNSPLFAEEKGIDPNTENPYQVFLRQIIRGERINHPSAVVRMINKGINPRVEIPCEMVSAYFARYGIDTETEQSKRLSELITKQILPKITARLDDENPVTLKAIQNLLTPPPAPMPYPKLQIARVTTGESSLNLLKQEMEIPRPPKTSSFHKAINEALLLSKAILLYLHDNKEEMPENSIVTAAIINHATLLALAQEKGEQTQETVHAFHEAAQILGIPENNDQLIDALCELTNAKTIKALNALIRPLLDKRDDLTVKTVIIDQEAWPFVTGVKNLDKNNS